eukprot:CCRYP_005554-RA/>CCRYP_005554-RA protein AED:0.28 eAED:0.73 QI:185/0/0.5/1/0/0/2/0/118
MTGRNHSRIHLFNTQIALTPGTSPTPIPEHSDIPPLSLHPIIELVHTPFNFAPSLFHFGIMPNPPHCQWEHERSRGKTGLIDCSVPISFDIVIQYFNGGCVFFWGEEIVQMGWTGVTR